MLETFQLNEVIAKAEERAGGATRLAAMLGCAKSDLSHWKSGKNRVPAEYHALMLTITGVPFERASAEALLAANAHKKLGQTLLRAAGKLTAIFSAFGLGVVLFMGSGFAQPAWSHGAKDDNVYYVN